MTDQASGRVVGVVGPSGAGKDSVMQGLAKFDSNYRTVRRVITRASELGGEDYEPVDLAEFKARETNGAFCLSWGAHGLHYGIPNSVRSDVVDGAQLLVNLSRSVLLKAHEVLPNFIVLNITASPQTLQKRLAARGRESHEDIMARLARTVPLPEDRLHVVTISNNSALEEAITAAHEALSAKTITDSAVAAVGTG